MPTKKPVKKVTAKKSVAKKSTAKVTAKKVVKKAVSKKPVAKKALVKKVVKKAVAKKAPVKKSAAKKPVSAPIGRSISAPVDTRVSSIAPGGLGAREARPAPIVAAPVPVAPQSLASASLASAGPVDLGAFPKRPIPKHYKFKIVDAMKPPAILPEEDGLHYRLTVVDNSAEKQIPLHPDCFHRDVENAGLHFKANAYFGIWINTQTTFAEHVSSMEVVAARFNLVDSKNKLAEKYSKSLVVQIHAASGIVHPMNYPSTRLGTTPAVLEKFIAKVADRASLKKGEVIDIWKIDEIIQDGDLLHVVFSIVKPGN